MMLVGSQGAWLKNIATYPESTTTLEFYMTVFTGTEQENRTMF